MARYWVWWTGNWSDATNHWATTSGGAPWAGNLPTATEDVFFDSASHTTSYTVTIDATTKLCRDLTFAAPASWNVTWAGSVAMTVSGSLTLYSGLIRTYTWALTFNATSTGKTITMAGTTLASAFSFSGTGWGWTLQDTFNNGSGTITITAGTLDTNWVTVTAWSITSSGTTTRALTLGASSITLSAINTVSFSGTWFTFTCWTSTITLTTTAPNVSWNGHTFYNVTYTASTNGSISWANTFNNLSITSWSTKLGKIEVYANQTINGTLTINGNSTINRILVDSNPNAIATPSTLTAAAVSITYADFRNITAAGAASWDLSAITWLSWDCWGNTGITFTTPVSQTWTNTSGGSWSTAANWTSRVPLPQDDVSLNCAFTTSRTVTADMPRLGKAIDWTGATFTTSLTFTLSTAVRVFGSLTLISGLTLTGAQTMNFWWRDGSFTVNTFGTTSTWQYYFSPKSSTYTLQSDIISTSAWAFSFLSPNGWTSYFVVNWYNITAAAYSFSGATGSSVDFGSGLITVTGSNNVWTVTSTITVIAGTSTIKFTDTSNTAITFNGAFSGGTKTYYNLWFDRWASTGNITITDNLTFNDFKDTGTAAHSILFTTGRTYIFTTFTVSGNWAGNEITINSTTTGTHTLSAPSKNNASPISCDYLNIQHSIVLQANTWYAWVNSVNNQAVATAGSGWIFTAPAIVLSDTSSFFQLF